jgi:hypothetical protein
MTAWTQGGRPANQHFMYIELAKICRTGARTDAKHELNEYILMIIQYVLVAREASLTPSITFFADFFITYRIQNQYWEDGGHKEEIQLPTERMIIRINADDDDDSDYSDYEEIDEEESDDNFDDSMLPEVEYGGAIVVPVCDIDLRRPQFLRENELERKPPT